MVIFSESQATSSETSDPSEEEDKITDITWSTRDEDCLEQAKKLRDLKTLNKIKSMVRQGAPFCCLPLFDIKPLVIPENLPLPKRLAAIPNLERTPHVLLQYLKPPKSGR